MCVSNIGSIIKDILLLQLFKYPERFMIPFKNYGLDKLVPKRKTVGRLVRFRHLKSLFKNNIKNLVIWKNCHHFVPKPIPDKDCSG